MGYTKGILAINPTRDVPMLRQVLYSVIVSRTQLLEFMRLNHFESSRVSFNWRLRRLVDHHLICMHRAPSISDEHLFTISSEGLLCLERHGEFCPAALPIPLIDTLKLNPVHVLDLNDIHLAALRTRQLVNWTYELQLRSFLLLGSSLYAKAYDAVLDVLVAGSSVTFALEYERTQKSVQDYLHIREAIEADHYIHTVLYLMPSSVLASAVARHFRGSRHRIYFGLVEEFKASLLDTTVSDPSRMKSFPLHQVLKGRNVSVV